MTYYAISDVNGPCSRELDASTLDDALVQALGEEQDQAVEDGAADIEDALRVNLAGVNDWREALEDAGASHVCDAGGTVPGRAVGPSSPFPTAPIGAVEIWSIE